MDLADGAGWQKQGGFCPPRNYGGTLENKKGGIECPLFPAK
jgi:hypothetical protein